MKTVRPKTWDITDLNKRRFTEDLWKLIRRNISYGHTVNGDDQNIDGKMVEILDTGVAGTVNNVTHNLGRVPLFIDFKYKNVAGDCYDAGTAWTKTQVFLKFTIDHMHVRLFIH